MNRLAVKGAISRYGKAAFVWGLLIILGVVGYHLRTKDSNTFMGINTVSHFYSRAQYLQVHGTYLKKDALSQANAEFKEDYPPLLAYATVIAYRVVSFFSRASFADFTAYFPVFMYYLLFFSGFVLLRWLFSLEAGLLFAALISILGPSLRLTKVGYYTSECLGVVLLLASVCFLFRLQEHRRFVGLTILCATLLMLTWQLFVVFVIAVVFFLLVNVRSREYLGRYLLVLVVPFVLSHIISVYLIGLDYSPFKVLSETFIGMRLQGNADYAVAFHRSDLNPVVFKDFLRTYGWLSIVLCAGGVIACIRAIKEPRYYGLLFISALCIGLGFRYQKYEMLTFPFLAMLASVGGTFLYTLFNFPQRLNRAAAVILCVIFGAGICATLFLSYKFLNPSWQFRQTYGATVQREKMEVFRWLKAHSQPNDIVLCPWGMGAEVSRYAQSPVVAQAVPWAGDYAVWHGEIKERYDDTVRFFFAKSETQARQVADKYKVKFILLPTHLDPALCDYADSCSTPYPDNYVLTPDEKSTTVIGRMLSRSCFDNFELVMDSVPGYRIYKVKEHPENLHFGLLCGRDLLIGSLFKDLTRKALPGPVFAAIVPHHYEFVRKGIAFVLDTAVASRTVKRVILLGPSHYGRRPGVVTSLYDWKTGMGKLDCDRQLAGALVSDGIAQVDEGLFETEHAISTIVPFIKYRIPEARIVPIIVGNAATPQTLQRLAHFIAQAIDGETLVLVSVDFSHRMAKEAALEADQQSACVLARLDLEALPTVISDANKALTVLLTALKEKNILGVRTLGVKNSADFGGDPKDTVGYIGMVYFPEPAKRK